jgi:hypothetical protein
MAGCLARSQQHASRSEPLMRDYRDDALEHLALDEAELREKFVDAILDSESYRFLACQAIGQIRELTLKNDELRAERDRLRDQYRHLRASVMGADASRGAAE